MPRYKVIYEQKAAEYDLLVSREDYQGNILKALTAISPLKKLEVAEFGAGTGRLTLLLAPHVAHIKAFDAYPAMITVGNSKLKKLGIAHVSLEQAENKKLPLQDASVDLSIAGWTFGHCTSWFPETWRTEISAAVQEMIRVTKIGGTAIILETLGTGKTEPHPPNEKLAEYYSLLEKEFGFVKTWIRTDYCFQSAEEALHLTSTFFGRDYAFQSSSNDKVILPECTGIWSKKI